MVLLAHLSAPASPPPLRGRNKVGGMRGNQHTDVRICRLRLCFLAPPPPCPSPLEGEGTNTADTDHAAGESR